MQLLHIPVYGLLLLFLNMQLSGAHPISNSLTDDDVDVLRLLLHRLEESIPEKVEVQEAPAESLGDINVEAMAEGPEDQGQEPQATLDEAMIREFLSAKNLKTVRNDSSRKTSGCFGRRMDRIGSMSSLGCNTVGRFNPKTR